jgi:hypothetical protein
VLTAQPETRCSVHAAVTCSRRSRVERSEAKPAILRAVARSVIEWGAGPSGRVEAGAQFLKGLLIAGVETFGIGVTIHHAVDQSNSRLDGHNSSNFTVT